MQKRVLLVADNANRDLLGTRMVESALQRRGVKTALYTLRNIALGFRRFRPHAFVSCRGNLPVTRAASRCCRVYILPGEGAQLTRDTMLPTYIGQDYHKLESADWIRRCYVWGEAVRGWLMETGMFRKEQLLVAGNCKLDVYRNYTRARKQSDSFVVGVAFSVKSISSYYGDPHHPENYFDFHPELRFGVTRPGRHFEDIVWKDHAILRRMMRYIRRLLEEEGGRILFRPNPLEDFREYLFLEKRYPGRARVMLNQPLIEFLSSIDVLLTCWSTTGMEALLTGTPVISIAQTIDQDHLFRHICPKASGFETYVPFYHLPESEDQLFEMLALAKQGLLPVSPKSKSEFDRLVKMLYNWPYRTAASEIVADDLVRDLEDAEEVPEELWERTFPIPYNIPLRFAPAAYWAKSFTYFLRKEAFKPLYDFYRTQDRRINFWVNKVAAEIAKEQTTVAEATSGEKWVPVRTSGE